MASLQLARPEPGVAVLTLDRPDRHNVFDEALLGELTAALEALAAETSLRVLVLTGAGRSFSAGADLGWMARAATLDEAGNLADAARLERLLRTLDVFPRPTIVRVNGAAIGGGVGLVAAADIAIAAEDATFALREVRLGLVAAVIAPYVQRAIGERQARRYLLTAERFGAADALAIGLVHRVAPAGALDAAVAETIAQLQAGGPDAMTASKSLLRALRADDPSAVGTLTTQVIAERRASPEGREGVQAFLEKRQPAWRRKP